MIEIALSLLRLVLLVRDALRGGEKDRELYEEVSCKFKSHEF
jgi:hypothetical protein